MAMKLSNPPEEPAAAVEAAIAAIPDEPAAAPPQRPWLLVDVATPRDGTMIETKADPDMPDERSVHAVWRTTRTRAVPPARGWAIVAFWADPLTKRRLSPEPFVWRMLEGNVLPTGVMGQM